ncbi:MAG: hypothetical protein WAX04_06515 [Oscillospiraceae bacterium]
MKVKRIALLLATLIAATTVMTACAEKAPKDTGSTASKTTVADGDRAMEGNMYTEGLPIVKEQETFTLLCDDNGKAEDKIMYPILQEQTNVKVDLLLYPYEIAKEKKNILINSGNYPDAIGGWLLSDDEILRDGMGEGLYIPINDLIDKYAPKMTEMLAIEGVRDTMTLPDGKIYTVPYVIGTKKVAFQPVINSKWLEAVGKKMPTTTEEFADVLRAFKTKDPNGNGKADEIAFSADPDNNYFGFYSGWFGFAFDKTNFSMSNGKLEFGPNKDAYKETIKYFAGLYKEGLIDPEIFTQDLSQWKAKGEQGLYGSALAYGAGEFIKRLPDPSKKSDFDGLPVLKAPGVDKPVYKRASTGSYVFRTQLAITDKAKNPATIIRWFNNVFEEENSMQIDGGLFGKRLEKLSDGQYRRLDETKLSDADKEKYGWSNMFTTSLPKFCPLDKKPLPAEGVALPYEEKDVMDALYEPFLDEQPANVWTSQEDAKRVSTIQTDINKYVLEQTAVWVGGQSNVEADWDKYLKQLDKLGLQELITIKQKAQEAATK